LTPCDLRVITSGSERVRANIIDEELNFVAVLEFFILKSAIFYQSKESRAFLITQETFRV